MSDGGGRFEDEFAAMRRDAYRVAFGVLADRQLADDAASEALIQAWLHWSKIGMVDYRTAWLRRVTLNCAFRILRKRSRREAVPAHASAEFEDEIVLRLAMSRALLILPRRQRETMAMRYLGDLPDSDIAAALGISVNSVKKHLQRGMAALRTKSEFEEVGRHATAPTT